MFLNVTKVILKPYWWFISLLRVTAVYKWPIRFSELFEFQLRRALCKLNSTRYIYSFIRFWSRNEYRNFYSPQTFKIVALQMATRPLFVPVNMSTVVPSFNSTAPTTFFSFTTLTLFSFSHWTTIKPIFRIAILSKTVEKRINLTHKRSIVEQYIQRWALNGVFFVSDHGHDHVDLSGIVIG